MLVLAFPGEELPSLVATSFLEIAGRERSSANSVIIAGVSRGVSECGRWLPMRNLLRVSDITIGNSLGVYNFRVQNQGQQIRFF